MNEQISSLVKQLKVDSKLASFDEAATKQIVILRVLSLLGWDIYNRDEVYPEFAVGKQRVDFSLRHDSDVPPKNCTSYNVSKIGQKGGI